MPSGSTREIVPTDTYYDNVNLDLLQRIPPNAANILEVGCGAGALGREHKQRFSHCRYVGVELEGEAAAIARQRLDEVIARNVESLHDLPGSTGAPFDCILFGDVLEHLKDPWAVLAHATSWLSPGGIVVACIPNIQHWSILGSLLAGHWDYTDAGLLDRTHLRFFTLDGILALFQGAGLTVQEVVARHVGETPAVAPFLHALTPALNILGVDANRFNATARAFQYVVTANRAAVTR